MRICKKDLRLNLGLGPLWNPISPSGDYGGVCVVPAARDLGTRHTLFMGRLKRSRLAAYQPITGDFLVVNQNHYPSDDSTFHDASQADFTLSSRRTLAPVNRSFNFKSTQSDLPNLIRQLSWLTNSCQRCLIQLAGNSGNSSQSERWRVCYAFPWGCTGHCASQRMPLAVKTLPKPHHRIASSRGYYEDALNE